MFNALDIAILVVFMAIIGAGFFGGVTRITAAVFAIYFGAIAAATFYRPVAEFARDQVPMGVRTSWLIFFTLLFVAFSVIFTVVFARWLGDLQLPRRIAILDNIAGAALGLVVSGLALTVAAMVLWVMLQAMNQVALGTSDGPALGMVRGAIEGSKLVPIFLRMAPFFTRVMAPWFPGGLPPILSSVPEG